MRNDKWRNLDFKEPGRRPFSRGSHNNSVCEIGKREASQISVPPVSPFSSPWPRTTLISLYIHPFPSHAYQNHLWHTLVIVNCKTVNHLPGLKKMLRISELRPHGTTALISEHWEMNSQLNSIFDIFELRKQLKLLLSLVLVNSKKQRESEQGPSVPLPSVFHAALKKKPKRAASKLRIARSDEHISYVRVCLKESLLQYSARVLQYPSFLLPSSLFPLFPDFEE